MVPMLRMFLFALSCLMGRSMGGGDLAEDVVETSALDAQGLRFPVMRAQHVADRAEDRPPLAGEDHQRMALAILDWLDRSDIGKIGERGLGVRLVRRGEGEAHGV